MTFLRMLAQKGGCSCSNATLSVRPPSTGSARRGIAGAIEQYVDWLTERGYAALSDPQPIVRMTAALGLSGPAEAASDEPRTALLEALHDERRVVRVAAMIALVQRGVGSLDGAQARHFARARDEYLERAAQYPEDSAMQLELGKLRFRLGEYGGAAEAFEAASRLEPDLAGASYFLGVARLGEQRIEEGRRLLKRVPRSDPYFDAAKRLLRELRDKEVSP